MLLPRLNDSKISQNVRKLVAFAKVEKVEFFSLDKIQEMINDGEKFHPELLFLLEKHFEIKPKK